MKALVAAFLAGLSFGAGLIISGMADPANVVGFLDVAGSWNPSLAFVMGGGLVVSFVGYRLAFRRMHPLLGDKFQLPQSQAVDARLLGGAALFGAGWGLVGYCPGPALVAALGGMMDAVWLAAGMVAGMLAWQLVGKIYPTAK